MVKTERFMLVQSDLDDVLLISVTETCVHSKMIKHNMLAATTVFSSFVLLHLSEFCNSQIPPCIFCLFGIY